MFRTKIKKREAEIIENINSLADCTPEQKQEKIRAIQSLYAMELFDNKLYDLSIKEFNKINTDPAVVIKRFFELDSDDKEKAKKNISRDQQTALYALMKYLKKLKANTTVLIESTDGEDEVDSAQTQRLELIDTTLLKCYLLLNIEVTPLLRSNNNCCLEEAEKVLLQYRKHRELLILYQSRCQHTKALQLLSLLREQANEHASDLDIYLETSNYLQKLGVEHIQSIFKFSGWILKEHPKKGLEIFTKSNVDVEQLPRDKVLEFLNKDHEILVIPYLEHVVHKWNDTNSLFHNSLIEKYREQITDKKGNRPDAEVQQIRYKLVTFLEKSAHYTPERVVVHFPTDSLFEERAIIYGKLGRHEQALAIFVLILGDVEQAIRYCENVHSSPNDKGRDVFVTLMRILIDPEQCSVFIDKSLANVPRRLETATPDLERALNILDEYANKIAPLQALSVLPDSIPLDRLKHFLECAMEGQLMLKRRMEVLKGLWYADMVQTQELLQFTESKSVVITDGSVCSVCKKRFGNHALVRYPNGRIVHFSCRLNK